MLCVQNCTCIMYTNIADVHVHACECADQLLGGDKN